MMEVITTIETSLKIDAPTLLFRRGIASVLTMDPQKGSRDASAFGVASVIYVGAPAC
jgi:hypothetical protein